MSTLTCPRCGTSGTGFAGCPRCRAEDVAVNLVPPLADLRGKDLAAYRGGPWGWPDALPLPSDPATASGPAAATASYPAASATTTSDLAASATTTSGPAATTASGPATASGPTTASGPAAATASGPATASDPTTTSDPAAGTSGPATGGGPATASGRAAGVGVGAAGWPDLGEGDTPLVLVEDGAGGQLWVKDESRNPTGSHKDRAMAVGVAAAVAAGADTVVAATSGNAGASAAAYAARAGLRCVVLTTTVPGVLAAQIEALGAALAGYPDGDARNAMMDAGVRELGWYPLTNYVRPVAGANPYAIEGYKSIAYELARDLDPAPDAVVIPTSAADLLAGVERGYRELADAGLVAAVPRLVAAETATGAAFTAALRQADRAAQERTRVDHGPSPAFSIGNATPAWQGLDALWRTGGTAVAVEVDDYMDEHRRLPRATGLFLEAASAAAVRAARHLIRDGARRVVALGTGSGLKGLGDPAPLPAPATLAELDALAERAATADPAPVTADPATAG